MHAKIAMLLLAAAQLCAWSQPAELPGTQPLKLEGDLSAQMVAGINRFLSNQTPLAASERPRHWRRDFSSPAAYEQSIAANRARLKTIIGAFEPRVPFQELELIASTSQAALISETAAYTIQAVRWPVLAGVHGEGLRLRPKAKAQGAVIALPDADQTPEMLCGLALGLSHEAQFARRLAEAGWEVFVPVLINRSDAHSGNEELNRFTNQPHREWIYRQAYELGGHVIGYEVQKVLALADWLTARGSTNLAVAGYGEGGLIALYSAALDPRLKSALVSGYFSRRERLWEEPIYRNVFGLLEQFGDAEIASLIAPRALIVEYSETPQISGPPAPRPGRGGAAPGRLSTPERFQVEEELNRARAFFPAGFPVKFEFVEGNEGTVVPPGTAKALSLLCENAGGSFRPSAQAPVPVDARAGFDGRERQRQQVQELVDHAQHDLIRTERLRQSTFWKDAANLNAEQWQEKRSEPKRQFWEEVIGRFPSPDAAAMEPRSRLILDEPKWRGYDVTLQVWPDVFAWGILLLPKDLQPGEKRPVVVCQHGLEGVPRDTIDGPGSNGYGPYKAFSARLAERGFIVFAPHNPYRGQDKFRVLQRMANPLGKSLFSVIIGQHEQILNWLEALPFVDPKRIGFYGLSYGGKTAMRVPAVLERYALSICSADFNEWVKKNATVHSPYSYMFTIEYEMPEFALGRTFNYAEMAALIAPRPFMVERGHDDGVAPDEWVAYEFAKVRRFYSKLGIGDRAEIEFFNGPHTINGAGTFRFLHQHLNWPEPAP